MHPSALPVLGNFGPRNTRIIRNKESAARRIGDFIYGQATPIFFLNFASFVGSMLSRVLRAARESPGTDPAKQARVIRLR